MATGTLGTVTLEAAEVVVGIESVVTEIVLLAVAIVLGTSNRSNRYFYLCRY